MSNNAVRGALEACGTSYQRFAAVLSQSDISHVRLDEITVRWRDHYFADFAQFDQNVMRHVLSGRATPNAWLALSVSHHNLHRLMEVLELEIGDRSLDTSRVPERILDLVEVVNGLSELFHTALSHPHQ